MRLGTSNMSSFSVGHLLFGMHLLLRVVCFHNETFLEKTKVIHIICKSLSVGKASGLGVVTYVYFSFQLFDSHLVQTTFRSCSCCLSLLEFLCSPIQGLVSLVLSMLSGSYTLSASTVL